MIGATLIVTQQPSCAVCEVDRNFSRIGIVWRGFVRWRESEDHWGDDWVGFCHNCKAIVPVIMSGKEV